jgi:PHD/YefM family antitoxin component YafN of YafNO toxin-antitoxin module
MVFSKIEVRPVKAKRKRKDPEIVMRGGKPAAIILDIDEYRELLERVEDADDLKMLKQMRKRPLKFRKLEDVLKDFPRVWGLGWTDRWTRSAIVAQAILKRIIPRIKALSDNPRPSGCHKLTGSRNDWPFGSGIIASFTKLMMHVSAWESFG